MTDVVDNRLEVAKSLGATHVYKVEGTTLVYKVEGTTLVNNSGSLIAQNREGVVSRGYHYAFFFNMYFYFFLGGRGFR